jgi:hypothetical protein
MADPSSASGRGRSEARVRHERMREGGMGPKDWLSIVLSVVALLTSAGTAYFTSMRQTDILRLEVNTSPILSMDSSTARLSLKGDLVFFLINAGSRPAVVSALHLNVGEIGKDGKCGGTKFEAGMDAFVVPAKDIVSKRVRFKPGVSTKAELHESGDEISFAIEPSAEGKSAGAMCVTAQITTPSRTGVSNDVRLLTYNFDKEGGSTSRIVRSIPTTIWRETSSILGE